MTRFFTSDEHYGHRNIIHFSKRPFASIEEMHGELVSRHNAVVSPYDEVWHLGDFAMDDRLVPAILPKLNGTHYLVCGNHDRCHPCHKKHEAAKRKYLLWGFRAVWVDGLIDGFRVCHLPYRGDTVTEARPNGEERYVEHRQRDDGRVLLHGHVHELWKLRGNMVNVGVDQWGFAPVRQEQLEDFVAGAGGRKTGGVWRMPC